jgi:hypothetical protein
MVQYLVDSGCPLHRTFYDDAVKFGHVNILRCLREHVDFPVHGGMCAGAAIANQTRMLLYLHEQGAALNEMHIFGREDVEMVSYLRQQGWTDTNMPWRALCDRAAGWDNLELLKWAHEVEGLPLRWQACWQAATRGHIRPIEYMFNKLADQPPDDFFHGQLCIAAAENGSVELLKFLVHNGFSLHADVLKAAVKSFSRGSLDVVKYLIECSCPT